MKEIINDLLSQLDHSVQIVDGQINIENEARLRETIHLFAEISALGENPQQDIARYLTRKIALAVGVIPASINDLYMARGRGKVPANFTVPAINLRALSFNAAKTIFRAAKEMNVGTFIFEIARSEMGYTDQRPTEYATSVLAAAIAEDYSGPVFIQGDHFQISAKRYAVDPEGEIQAVKQITADSIAAGFFNIDVDTSTLVDLDKASIPEQQLLNTELSALLTNHVRALEPEGITVSVGGEIGEVGGQNSTEEELRAYMDGFNARLKEYSPESIGLSKISIQTGTSHGGVVLPDGTIANVSVDFDIMLNLSRVSVLDYGMAGAVQHGASTLPEDAFGKFVEAEACEVHLATNFQTILYDLLPDDLRQEMYAYLRDNHSDERKAGQTDEQFYYKTRKRAIGPFKTQTWALPTEKKFEIENAWEKQFTKLFTLLSVADTRKYVDKYIHPVSVEPNLDHYLVKTTKVEDTSDLAD